MKTFSDIAIPGIKDLPVYEPGKPIGEVAREQGFDSEDSIIKLASNENALGPSRLAVRAMRNVAAQMHRYPEGSGLRLRQTLAGRLDLPVDSIVLGNGSNELIELLGRVFLSPGTSIVTAAHSFAVYRLVAAARLADVISVPTKKSMVCDLDAMRRAIRPDTRLVFLANPNNPTGTMVESEELRKFIEDMPDHVVMCIDEAYVELVPRRQPDTLRYIRDGRRVVVLRTFSKTYGLAGLRIGYGLAATEAIQLMNRVRQPFNVSGMAQAAALAALDDEGHVKRTRRMVRQGLTFLRQQLDQIGLPYVPGVANFMLVEVGNGRRVFEELLRKGVIVRPVDNYGLPQHIRITVGKPEENERLIAALSDVVDRTEIAQAGAAMDPAIGNEIT